MPRRVAVLLFDNVEVMDFAGPFEVFGVTGQREGKALFDVFTVAREMRPVLARNNLSVNPDYGFRDCPTADILVVPGGFGTRREKHNASVIDFIRAASEPAERVLSVCSGALLLAKAGLLDGLRATTHRGALAELAADAPRTTVLSEARVVDNGRIVLSAGISAGIDAALHIVGDLCGVAQAAETATYMEYDWRYRAVDGTAVVRAVQGAAAAG
jgi:transcriptional regulator GlxA family with amidase domain